ncbi:putative sagittal suture morphogenesis [Trypoxylus dichotomus]
MCDPLNQRFNPRYTIETLKHGGESVAVWASISWRGVGPIFRIAGEMMEAYADEFPPVTWSLMHDNDPKYTARTGKTVARRGTDSCVRMACTKP